MNGREGIGELLIWASDRHVGENLGESLEHIYTRGTTKPARASLFVYRKGIQNSGGPQQKLNRGTGGGNSIKRNRLNIILCGFNRFIHFVFKVGMDGFIRSRLQRNLVGWTGMGIKKGTGSK